MRESTKATKTQTWLILLLDMVTENKNPMTKSGFRTKIKKMNLECDDNKLGVLLNFAVKKGAIVLVKYPGTYGFYGLPEWIDKTGLFKKELEFDKFRVKFKKQPK